MREDVEVPDRPNYRYWQKEGAWWHSEYLRRMTADPLYPIQATVLSALFSNSAPMRIAEFGCGTGRHLGYLSKIDGLEVFGLDQSTTMVDAVRGVLGEEWFRKYVRVVDPVGRLPFADEFFDVTFSCEAIMHVSPDDLIGRLGEIVRISRVGVFHLEPAADTVIYKDAHCGSWNHDLVEAYRRLGYVAERMTRPCTAQQPVFVSKDDVWRPALSEVFLSQCAAIEQCFLAIRARPIS
jgi:SAM-dependent methyltransferase